MSAHGVSAAGAPLRRRLASSLLLALCFGAAAPSAHAAYLSELFFDDGQGETGMPTAVEVAGLDGVAADAVDLIVIDARTGSFGIVRRVITVPAITEVKLVSERAWHEQVWGPDTQLGEPRTTLEALGEAGDFDFAGARSVLLFDRPTRVEADGTQNLFSDAQQARLDGAEMLDALSVSFDAWPDPDAPGPVAEVAAGDAIVRPLSAEGAPGEDVVWGPVTADGRVAGLEPSLQLTPALENPSWRPVPEPTSGAVVLMGLAVLAGMSGRTSVRARARRQCLERR